MLLILSFKFKRRNHNGFITSTGLDTRVESGGNAIPHMLTTDKVYYANAIGADSTSNFYYSLGNSALTDFDVITGYGGSIYQLGGGKYYL